MIRVFLHGEALFENLENEIIFVSSINIEFHSWLANNKAKIFIETSNFFGIKISSGMIKFIGVDFSVNYSGEKSNFFITIIIDETALPSYSKIIFQNVKFSGCGKGSFLSLDSSSSLEENEILLSFSSCFFEDFELVSPFFLIDYKQ